MFSLYNKYFLLGVISLAHSFSYVSNETTTLSGNESFKKEVTERLKEASQSIVEFQATLKNKDAVIFLGSTKAGKSTLTNYIIGTPLEAYDSELMGLKIRAKVGSHGPEIGQTSLSLTAFPGVYPVDGTDLVIVDSPGFDDNRGAEQNIMNALYINQINYARTVRFVLVVDINEITDDNTNVFINSMEQMHNLLEDSEHLPISVAFIFTKVPMNYDQNKIANLLKRQFLYDELKIDKNLIQKAVDNQNLIGIFRIPERVGTLSDSTKEHINQVVRNSNSLDTKSSKVMLTLSDKAKEALLEVYPEYLDSNYFMEEVYRSIKEYKNFFQEKWVFASYDEELTSTKQGLGKIKISVEKELKAKRSALRDVQRSLETLLEFTSKRFKDNFEFIVMLDTALLVEEKYRENMKKHYSNSLKALETSVDKLLLTLESEIKQRKEDRVVFSSSSNFVTVSNTVAQILAHRIYNTTGNALTEVANKISGFFEMPKDALPTALSTLMPTDSKAATLEQACKVAEKAAQLAVKYGPKIATTAGVAGVVGGGTAAYMIYNEIFATRFELREAQHREVYSWLSSPLSDETSAEPWQEKLEL